MRKLQNFTEGPEVYFLQRLLNIASKKNPRGLKAVKEDGRFGTKTDEAVRSFQSQSMPHRLKVDGIAGPMTMRALGHNVDIDHNLTLIAQQTDWNCWQASASMVSEKTGRKASVATSPTHMAYYLSSGANGLAADTQLALEMGWNKLNHSPSLSELISILRRTPIQVSGILTLTGGAHAVAFGGIWSNGTPEGTVIKVYNPSPIGYGLIHHLFFTNMMSPISGSPFVPRDYLVP